MEKTRSELDSMLIMPANQRDEQKLKKFNIDSITGGVLTATIWHYFAGLQNHGAVISNAAEVFDFPALSYGLFHAQVRPNKLYGIVTTGVTLQGLNMDVGHLRHVRWVKDDNPTSPVNNKPELVQNGKSAAQNRWVAYNKMRGNYASAMEHAGTEFIWVDKGNCKYIDRKGSVKNPNLQPCVEAVSAVKAIAVAQQQGQKIFTINSRNVASALAILPVGGEVGEEIRSAARAGKEITVHEKPISYNGWGGYGYIIVDPETGAGAYLIQGSGNGAYLSYIVAALSGLVDALTKKLRNPDSMFGPYDEIARSKWINLLAKITTVLAFTKSIVDIVDNDKLSVPAKMAQITLTLAGSIIAMEGAAAMGLFLANPVAALVAGVVLALIIALLVNWANEIFAENL